MRVWLLAAALALTAPAGGASPPEYDLTWTAFARQAGWSAGSVEPLASGECSGRALARLVRVSPEVLRLDWEGPEGRGRGFIGPEGPTAFEFPSPLPSVGPPATPHLSGGTFEFSGDPDRPETFTVSYIEGFICRSTPGVCQGIAMWERRFEGRGRRRQGR